MKSDELASRIKGVLEEKKAKDIDTIDISSKTIIADWFVICSGTSVTHIRSLADEIAKQLSLQERRPLRVEGYDTARWILIDFGDVIAHVFHETERKFYNLERLWNESRLAPNQ